MKVDLGEQLQNAPQLTPSLNLLLPWSAVLSRLYVLSVKLKCYGGPQSRSKWISGIKLSVELRDLHNTMRAEPSLPRRRSLGKSYFCPGVGTRMSIGWGCPSEFLNKSPEGDRSVRSRPSFIWHLKETMFKHRQGIDVLENFDYMNRVKIQIKKLHIK